MEGRPTQFTVTLCSGLRFFLDIFFYPEVQISGRFYTGFHGTDVYGGGVRRRILYTISPELRVAAEVSLCYEPWMPYIIDASLVFTTAGWFSVPPTSPQHH